MRKSPAAVTNGLGCARSSQATVAAAAAHDAGAALLPGPEYIASHAAVTSLVQSARDPKYDCTSTAEQACARAQSA